MVGVRDQLEQAIGDEALDGGVDALARQAHPPGDLGHRERPIGERDRAEHLPSRAGQPRFGAELITPGEQQAVGPKDREDCLGGGVSGWRSLIDVRNLTNCQVSVNSLDLKGA
jgi:hypothetical protein